VRLVRGFRSEQADPRSFYELMAADSAAQLARYCELRGKLVLDVGGGAGEFSAAFTARGARAVLLEPDAAELTSRGRPPSGAVRGDGCRLPLRDGAVDVCFSSNVLEHVSRPDAFIGEMVRVTRPGGIIYLAFTNWLSPWGGHELSPWHYLGAEYAQRRYRRRLGREPKHQVGANLFPIHIGPTLRMLRGLPEVELLDARPRYYPPWCEPVLRVPVAREFVTWNLLVVMRRAGLLLTGRRGVRRRRVRPASRR
jgi:SAM-dependent methyltransferase